MLKNMISRSKIITLVSFFILFVTLWLLFSLAVSVVLTCTCLLAVYSQGIWSCDHRDVTVTVEKRIARGHARASGKLNFGDEYSPNAHKSVFSKSVERRLSLNIDNFRDIFSKGFSSLFSGFRQNMSTPLHKKLMSDKVKIQTDRTFSPLPLGHLRSPAHHGQKKSIISSSGPLLSSPFIPQVKRALGLSEASYLSPCKSTSPGCVKLSACHPSHPSLGILPAVRLGKRECHSLSESNTSMIHSPNTVKIAPLDHYSMSSPSRFLWLRTEENQDGRKTPDTHDVVTALKERRKRALGGQDKSTVDVPPQSKRRRQESQQSNASTSSLPPMPDILPDLSSEGYNVMRLETPGLKRPALNTQNTSREWEEQSISKRHKKDKNNSVLSSLSSSRRIAEKQQLKRKTAVTDKENVKATSKQQRRDSSCMIRDPPDTLDVSNELFRDKAPKESPSVLETPKTVVNFTPAKESRPETPASDTTPTKLSDSLGTKRKNLSIYSSLNAGKTKVAYANVMASLEDYDRDKEAEEKRVEQMLSDISAEEKKKEDQKLSSKKVTQSRSEDTESKSQFSSQLTTNSSDAGTTTASVILTSTISAPVSSAAASTSLATSRISSMPIPSSALSLASSSAKPLVTAVTAANTDRGVSQTTTGQSLTTTGQSQFSFKPVFSASPSSAPTSTASANETLLSSPVVLPFNKPGQLTTTPISNQTLQSTAKASMTAQQAQPTQTFGGGSLATQQTTAPQTFGGVPLSSQQTPAPQTFGGLPLSSQQTPAPQTFGGLPLSSQQTQAPQTFGGLPLSSQQTPAPQTIGGVLLSTQQIPSPQPFGGVLLATQRTPAPQTVGGVSLATQQTAAPQTFGGNFLASPASVKSIAVATSMQNIDPRTAANGSIAKPIFGQLENTQTVPLMSGTSNAGQITTFNFGALGPTSVAGAGAVFGASTAQPALGSVMPANTSVPTPTSKQNMFAFGMSSNTQVPTTQSFGSNQTVQTSTNSSSFKPNTPATTSNFVFAANTTSASAPVFGTSQTTPTFGVTQIQASQTQAFGVVGTKPNQSQVFGVNTTKPQQANQTFEFATTQANQTAVFGIPPTTQANQAVGFGTSTTPQANQMPAFGNQSTHPATLFNVAQAPSSGMFGSKQPSALPTAVFGTAQNSTNQMQAFGALQSASNPTPAFGTPQNSSISSLPFGASQNTSNQAQTFQFGATNQTLNAFGTGNETNQSNVNNKKNVTFNFAATSQGSSTPIHQGTPTSQTAKNLFGTSKNPSDNSGVFALAPSNAQTPQNGFVFGSPASQTGSNTMFAFGQNGSGIQSAGASKGFAFNAAAGTSNTQDFGSPAFGSPNFGASTPANNASGMFSVGSGSTAVKPRVAAKAKRRPTKR